MIINTPSGNDLQRTPNGLKRDAGCSLCRLSQSCRTVCVIGTGDTSSKAMIVGEAPGRSEDEGGGPFIGAAGALLDEILDEVGLDRDSLYITNAVKCRPPENRTPTKAELKKCSPWLQYEIDKIKPKVVLLLGAAAVESVLGVKGIKKLRGQPIEQNGVTYLPALHPAYILRNERTRGLLVSDLRKFRAMIEGGGLPALPNLNYRIVRTRLDVEDMIDDVSKAYGFCYDLETTSLSAFHGKIVSLGVGTPKNQWIVLINHPLESLPAKMVESIVERLDALDKPKAGHNVKFDAIWMLEHFGVRWHGEFDTMLAHYLLNENSLHGLDVVANEKYGAIEWDVPLSIKHGTTGTVEQHCRYLASDIMYTQMLWHDLIDELDEQPGIAKVFYDLLMPSSRMFVDIEHRGVYIDVEKFNNAEVYLRKQIGEAELELNKSFPGVNWGSPQQVAKVLFTQLGLNPLDMTAGGAPSTSESVLKRLADKHPVPALLMKRRAASQQLSFFIEGWKPFLVNNRLHPNFKLHGTVTGRLSCDNPNLQQVPRDPRIRELITAPPGWVLVEADLSQIELRILAELSNDPEMMRCFVEGIDIHWLTCMREIFRGTGYVKEIIETVCRAAGRNIVEYDECYELMLEIGPDKAVDFGPKADGDFIGWKEVRKRAKAINFGYAYGMWWKKFVDYARDSYDVIVTAEQAQASRVSYFELYNKLPAWHKKQKQFANRHGYVRSLFGRKRRLPAAASNEDSMQKQEAERQAINSPVQSFASDLNLAAGLELTARHSPRYFRIVGAVHDALLMEIRVDKVKEVVDDILKTMSHPALLDDFNIELRVPVEAEAKIGPWSRGVSPLKYYEKHGL